MDDASRLLKAGRLAGVAYLALIVFSIAGYGPLTALLTGEASAVLQRLLSSRGLLMLAMASSVIGFALWPVLGVLLYRLMSWAGQASGIAMMVFVVAGTAANLAALAQLLPLFASNLDLGTLAQAVHAYQRLVLYAQVFSGLWMFPFAWLVLRSRIAPRLLGACHLAGGVFYLAVFATAFDPGLGKTLAYRIFTALTGIPGEVGGELGMCLWLLIRGARAPDAATDRPSRRSFPRSVATA